MGRKESNQTKPDGIDIISKLELFTYILSMVTLKGKKCGKMPQFHHFRVKVSSNTRHYFLSKILPEMLHDY